MVQSETWPSPPPPAPQPRTFAPTPETVEDNLPHLDQLANAAANAAVAREAQRRADEQERKDWTRNYLINHADLFLPESTTPSVGARIMHKQTGQIGYVLGRFRVRGVSNLYVLRVQWITTPTEPGDERDIPSDAVRVVRPLAALPARPWFPPNLIT